MKQFSKKGLVHAANTNKSNNDGDESDDEETAETREWINDYVAEMEKEVAKLETEIAESKTKKPNKGKKNN